jgi:hypothetical protein
MVTVDTTSGSACPTIISASWNVTLMVFVFKRSLGGGQQCPASSQLIALTARRCALVLFFL